MVETTRSLYCWQQAVGFHGDNKEAFDVDRHTQTDKLTDATDYATHADSSNYIFHMSCPHGNAAFRQNDLAICFVKPAFHNAYTDTHIDSDSPDTPIHLYVRHAQLPGVISVAS